MKDAQWNYAGEEALVQVAVLTARALMGRPSVWSYANSGAAMDIQVAYANSCDLP